MAVDAMISSSPEASSRPPSRPPSCEPSQPPQDFPHFSVSPIRLEDLTPIPGDPPGLSMAYEIITPEHEQALVTLFRTHLEWPSKSPDVQALSSSSPSPSPDTAPPKKTTTKAKLGRKSLHYGYRFCYRSFAIDRSVPFVEFPPWLAPLVPTCRGEPPAQVCLQYYPPGAGIPPHTDTHSAFDELAGLSLGAPVYMDFRRGRKRRLGGESEGGGGSGGGGYGDDGQGDDDGRETTTMTTTTTTTDVTIDLPPRSLMRMDADARLHWTHGIRKRKTDKLPDGTVRPRGDRWSITFRWLRRGGAECGCGDPELCDSEERRRGVEKTYRWKGGQQRSRGG